MAAALAAGALALVAAGCGGGGGSTSSQNATAPTGQKVRLSKTAYEQKMRTLRNQLGQSIDDLYPLSTGTKGSATANATVVKLQKARIVASGVLAQLEQIVPPAAIAKQHRQLENGVSTLVTQLGQMIKNTETGDVAGFVGGSNLTAPLQMINAAAHAMNSAGYDVIGENP
jgi:hypothetical protein